MREADFRQAIADRSQAPPHLRFPVYRNNADQALINALWVRYPVVERLIGAKRFAALAGEYASRNLPRSAVLIDYGESFPQFIDGYSLAAATPYIGDLARLESLWWRAYHAADERPLDVSRLADCDFARLGLTFHASVSLLASSHAVGSIWQAGHNSGSLAAVDLTKPENVLIARPEAEVEIRIIPADTYAFLSSLQAGETLAVAVETALREHSDFDLPAQLRALLASRIVTGFTATQAGTAPGIS